MFWKRFWKKLWKYNAYISINHWIYKITTYGNTINMYIKCIMISCRVKGSHMSSKASVWMSETCINSIWTEMTGIRNEDAWNCDVNLCYFQLPTSNGGEFSLCFQCSVSTWESYKSRKQTRKVGCGFSDAPSSCTSWNVQRIPNKQMDRSSSQKTETQENLQQGCQRMVALRFSLEIREQPKDKHDCVRAKTVPLEHFICL
jgi:hypothetical protein